jgi:exopolyphosphatase/guanosine-5'-triphosphate,3'-diphosphate pyrophosphatase
MTEPRIRVAAFDCGTNTIRLLICDLQGDTKTDHLREMKIVRLGQDVDRTGHLADEAIGRTLSATRDYAELIPLLGVERIVFCATSAVRDADNGEAFSDAIEGILGVRPIILDGPSEARATFLGATRELEPTRTLVVDIGGGSTEVVVGVGEEIESAVSLDIGSVRLTERFLPGDPPTVDEITACTEYVDS